MSVAGVCPVTPSGARTGAAVLLLGLPLASGWLAGFPPGFTELPPTTVSLHPPAFSAPVYAGFTVLALLTAAFLAAPGRFGFGRAGHSELQAFDWALAPAPGERFPRHGWAGVALIAAAWPAAWIRPDWLGPVNDHTFFPLWLGYILAVDGLVRRRAGASPLAHRRRWLAWFPASAAAWWYFEFLNGFVQNWVYLGVEDFSTLRYVLGTTLAFTTVIPAVLTTASLLATFPWFRERFTRPAGGAAPSSPKLWWAAVAAGAAGLALMPWLPIPLFALIWIAPLAVVAGLLELAGYDTGLGHLRRGDWGPVVTMGVAALVCGAFWELWNIHAMPKWTYQIPWVNRFHLFEMPLVGYLGYLPFGTACWTFWLLLSPRRQP